MRLIALSAALLLSGCSEYDLTGPALSEDGVIDGENPNDPDNQSSPLDAPVAVCSSDPAQVRPPFETNTFFGDQSYDPEDVGIERYDWTLTSAPSGSNQSLRGAGANRTFTADQAGTYTAQLVVTTTDGRVSPPCTATLEAVPAEALWVEMFWQYSGDDMDLHLLRPGGAVDSAGDCHWTNCDGGVAPDWGVQGDPSDDPSLDLDDIGGTGPENINIGAPEFGTFTVMVHDYPGSVYDSANAVTVNIYIDGRLEWTDTRDISGEDSKTYFADVDWPTAAIRTR